MGQILIPTALAEQIEAEARELHADDYRGQPVNICQGQAYKSWPRRGYTSIHALEFLNEKPWDDVALGFVHALRPSIIRVVTDGVQLDARPWRVTVWLRKDGKTIHHIEQEVEVALPKDVQNGHELNQKLKD